MNDPIAAHFEAQAKACDSLGSLFTARICRSAIAILDASTETGKCILDWPGDLAADAVSLRLAGGLHALVLSGADASLAAVYPPNGSDDGRLTQALAAAIRNHDAELVRFLASPPQTNEIARSGVLLPGFLVVARRFGRPLAIHEIGSSAGLNLNFDRFHYSYGPLEWGDAGSPVRLSPEIKGGTPPVEGALSVASRQGCDIAPINLADRASRLRLRSYVWADQPARLERLDAAIRVAAAFPNRVAGVDAADFVRESLAERQLDQAFVLFHSIMWQYMSAATRLAIEQSMQAAGADASESSPIAWLRMEPGGTGARHAALSLTSWPGGRTEHLANCDYHGRWIEWLAGLDQP